VWSYGTGPYSFWRRYLDVFDEVQVVARVADAPSAAPTWKRADGAGVTFYPVPYYVGPLQYARKFFSIRRSIRKAVDEEDAVIMRVSSGIALHLERSLAPGRPFGLEVIGDVNEVFAPGVIRHPLRPFLRYWFTQQLRRQCQTACAIAYVTKEVLQRRYPPREDAFSTGYSSVELTDTAFAASPRIISLHSSPLRVVSVGTLEVLYKGFDVLIDAIAACIRSGLDLQLVIVGEGRCRSELERYARLRGIESRVTFAGRLPAGEAVRSELDRADLFVLASRTEGVPRAMIEAMARGLPCIGSTVGGIPELLPNEDLVPVGDARALARKIREVIIDPDRMTRMSAANLARARDYHASLLTDRRREFFVSVREATHQWTRKRPKPAFEPGALEETESVHIQRSQEQ
jgi:glycosyltransferase involved in cell wall biosynthesis